MYRERRPQLIDKDDAPIGKGPSEKIQRSYKPYNLESRPFYDHYKKSQSNYSQEPYENNANFLSNDKHIEMSLAIPKFEEAYSSDGNVQWNSREASNGKTIDQNLHSLEKSDIEAPDDLEQKAEGQLMMREVGLSDAHAAINPRNWFTSDVQKLERRIQYANQMGWMLVSFEKSASAKLQHHRNLQTCQDAKTVGRVEDIEGRLAKLERNWKPTPKNVERAGKNTFRFCFR